MTPVKELFTNNLANLDRNQGRKNRMRYFLIPGNALNFVFLAQGAITQ